MPASHSPVTSSTYLDAVKYRRTVYGVTDKITIPDERIIEIVNEVIQSAPSSWNVQSTRILVTLGKEHKRFWNTVIDSAKPIVLKTQSEEDWERQETRYKSFRDAYGTVSILYLNQWALSGSFRLHREVFCQTKLTMNSI